MLQKRLNNGFNGFELPPIPRAARSARRRLRCRKRADDDQLCAFDLLATVAGELLEGENTTSATELLTGENRTDIGKDVNKNILAEDDPGKVKLCNEGSIVFVSDITSQGHAIKHGVKEVSHVQNNVCSPLPSVITTSDVSEASGSTAKLIGNGSKIEHGEFYNVDIEHFHSTISSSRSEVKDNNCVENGPSMLETDPSSATTDICCIEDVHVQDVKSHALGDSDNSVKLPVEASILDEGSQRALLRDHSPCVSFPIRRNSVKLVVRDDDENFSGCTPPRKLNKVLRPPARIGGRRIKRLLASRYWKATPQLSSQNSFNPETPVYHNRANCYKRQRSSRDYSLKRRRLYDRRYAPNAYRNASGSVATMHKADGASTFAASLQNCFQTNDSHVKLKIKSFRVPELFFEIPETATVGSLKRTVMEAVSAVLGGGLRVGVLVQGKKIRDDNISLVQTGIYNNNKNDALGFTLEPVSSQVPPTQCPEDHAYIPPPHFTRCPHPSIIVKQGASGVSPHLPVTNTDYIVESDYDSAPSPLDMSIDKCPTDSTALVAGAEIYVDELSAVPIQKSNRKDAGQRRIRRPFSVSEVEALVQAVEELGTGRWRDVKMQAFDSAKHRTYVDLKDKWKTLVHTAKISPQQRRGEPVPQDLLDRVLAAHAFWSQQQQPKQHTEACLLF